MFYIPTNNEMKLCFLHLSLKQYAEHAFARYVQHLLKKGKPKKIIHYFVMLIDYKKY